MTPAPSTPGWQNQIYEKQTTHTNQFIHHPASTLEGASGNFIQSTLILISAAEEHWFWFPQQHHCPGRVPSPSSSFVHPLSPSSCPDFTFVHKHLGLRSFTYLFTKISVFCPDSTKSSAFSLLHICPQIYLSRLDICSKKSASGLCVFYIFVHKISFLSLNVVSTSLQLFSSYLSIINAGANCPQKKPCVLSRLHVHFCPKKLLHLSRVWTPDFKTFHKIHVIKCNPFCSSSLPYYFIHPSPIHSRDMGWLKLFTLLGSTQKRRWYRGSVLFIEISANLRFPSQLVVSYELHVLANLKIKLASTPANSKKSDDKKKLFVKKAAASMKQTMEKWMEDTLVHSTKGRRVA